MEKTFRVLGDEGEDSTPSHSHTHTPTPSATTSGASISKDSNDLRSRSKKEDTPENEETNNQVAHKTSKLSAYLNLFGDFTHNMYVITHP